uniref:Carboxypeptidase regulatory-like domain-containing protein n=1 Tax=Gongylonema pulchrum TaxID=637853 RepID=A0A183EFC8_9BILA
LLDKPVADATVYVNGEPKGRTDKNGCSKGRVFLLDKPVADATAYVNGEPKGRTDKNGWYTLDGLQDEDYTITAKKEHYAFNTVDVNLSTKNVEIPNITVERSLRQNDHGAMEAKRTGQESRRR